MTNAFNLLRKEIVEWLRDSKGYLEPTDPQTKAIPLILNGKNVLLRAPTGYGKTLAVMLPLVNKVSQSEEEGIQVLYIAPLKALNRDVFQRVVQLGAKVWVDIDIRHGDTSKKTRISQTKLPPKILITTPETLQVLLVSQKLKHALKNVKSVVVDEIHELYESKRGSQLSVALERLEQLSGPFQRIGLSATIGDTKKISKFLVPNSDCLVLETNESRDYNIKIEYPEPTADDEILSKELGVSKNNAYFLRKTKEYFKKCKNCLIFTNTRQMAEILGNRMKKYFGDEYPIEVHHSSLSKHMRLDVEEKFKSGKLKSIIATSSLELGIDIGDIDLVIQYGSPRQVTKMAQRMGRGGHRIGEISRGIVFPIGVDDTLESTAIIKKLEEKWLEKPSNYDKPYDVLVNQIVAILVSSRKEDNIDYSKKDVYNLMKRSDAFKNLTYKEFDKVIKFMERTRMLYLRDDILIRSRKAFSYFFENISMIPDERSYQVIDELQNRRIGILHQGFVVEHCKPGNKFLMKGDAWRINNIDGDRILVMKADDLDGATPSWEGELIPVSKEVALKVGALRIDSPASKMLKQRKKFVLPDEKTLFFEAYENIAILHSCFGNKINGILANVLSALASSKIGTTVGTRTDAYRIIFSVPDYENPNVILRVLEEVKPEWIEEIVKNSLKNSTLFIYKFFQIAKKLGILTRNSEFTRTSGRRLMTAYENTPAIEETFKEIMTNKFDLAGVVDLLEKIKSGRIKVVNSSAEELSPLGVMGLETNKSFTAMRPEIAEGEIERLIHNRLLKKKWFFICTHCGHPKGIFETGSFVKNTQNIDDVERLNCSSCSSVFVGFARVDDRHEVKKDISKRNRGLKFDKKLISQLDRTATLNEVYGANSAYVMSAYGIGPSTATRILRKIHKNRKDLTKSIIMAERTFLRTKRFWS